MLDFGEEMVLGTAERSTWSARIAACALGLVTLALVALFVLGNDARAQTTPTILTSPLDSSIEWINMTGADQVMYVDCSTNFSFPYFSDFLLVEAGASLRFEITDGLPHGCRATMLNIPGQQLAVTTTLQSHCEEACFSWLPAGTHAMVAVTLEAAGPTPPDPPSANGPSMQGTFFDPRVVAAPSTTFIDVIGQAVPVSAPVDPNSLRMIDAGHAGLADVVVIGTPAIRHTLGATLEPVDWLEFELCDIDGRCRWYDFPVEIERPPEARDTTWTVPAGTEIASGLLHVDDLSWSHFGERARYTAAHPESATITRGPTHGTVEIVTPFVTFDYTPDPGFEGIDSFEYQACDTAGLCDSATITLVVGDVVPTPTPTPPPTSTPVPTATPTPTPPPEGTPTPVPPTPTPNPTPPAGAEGCTIWGTDGDDVLHGTDGDDVICGLGGDDIIEAGPGDDIVLGGPGNDDIRGQRGDDDLRGGPGDDRLRGGSGADELRGKSGADLLWGNSGADELLGGSGADRLRGGRGSDRIVGGTGDDRAWGGSGTDRLSGKRGDDRLFGGTGVDRLWGGGGDDLLSGGGGVDRLSGGSGFDRCLVPDVRIRCEAR